MKKKRKWLRFSFILVLAGLAGAAAIPGGPNLNLKSIGINYEKKLEIKQGLDLQGGTHLAYIAKIDDIEEERRDEAVESLRSIIQNRVDSFGVGEPVIQIAKGFDGSTKLVVELPGIKDVNQAIGLIGATAKMEFKELDIESAEGAFKETGLTGEQFTKADVVFDQNTGQPQINIQFNDEGAKLFSDITTRNVGKPIAIYLDDTPITQPNVNEPIKDGKAVITGAFDAMEAKNLSIQLNAGALPVPLELVEQRTVGATLGKKAVEKSFQAGVMGFILLLVFMIAYYRLPGIIASAALIIYLFIVMALFKLLSVTLTLAGIAGLILSIGIAVDANILIFERLKEELRDGKKMKIALNRGFQRAWTSIRDSNTTSLIVAFILYLFGTGPVRGFAITLSIGILVSMFTAIVITRNFMDITTGFKKLRKMKFYGVKDKEIES